MDSTCVWTGVHKTYGKHFYIEFEVTRDNDPNYKYKMMFDVKYLMMRIGCADILG